MTSLSDSKDCKSLKRKATKTAETQMNEETEGSSEGGGQMKSSKQKHGHWRPLEDGKQSLNEAGQRDPSGGQNFKLCQRGEARSPERAESVSPEESENKSS